MELIFLSGYLKLVFTVVFCFYPFTNILTFWYFCNIVFQSMVNVSISHLQWNHQTLFGIQEKRKPTSSVMDRGARSRMQWHHQSRSEMADALVTPDAWCVCVCLCVCLPGSVTRSAVSVSGSLVCRPQWWTTSWGNVWKIKGFHIKTTHVRWEASRIDRGRQRDARRKATR